MGKAKHRRYIKNWELMAKMNLAGGGDRKKKIAHLQVSHIHADKVGKTGKGVKKWEGRRDRMGPV